MRIPWTCVLGQLRAIKIYALWYIAQYSPWIFSVGTGMIIILLPCLVTFYATRIWIKQRTWNKETKSESFLYSNNSSVRNRFFFSTFKNLYRFLFRVNTDKFAVYRTIVMGFTKKKVTDVCADSFELQTVREQIFGNLNEDVPKVLSAALVPHMSVKFIECTRRFRRQHYLPLKYSIACIVLYIVNRTYT